MGCPFCKMPPNHPTPQSGFIPELNGLRACAIILVFLLHVRAYIPATHLPGAILQNYLGLGWAGVDLFFVLSGFLITGILLDTRTATNYFSGFYARRVLRIFPLYYVVLTAVILTGVFLNSSTVSAVLPQPSDRWLYYSYLTNWLNLWKEHWGRGYTNYLAHFWSLAVEEQFYFVWPLIVWLIPSRAVPWVAGCLAAFAALLRLAWVAHSGAQIAIAISTFTRMDALFIGALSASLFRNPALMLRARKWLPSIAILGIGSFLLAFSALLLSDLQDADALEDATMLLSQSGGYTALAIGFGALVLLAAYRSQENNWFQAILRSRTLESIGTYSYGIYVFHVPLLGAANIYLAPRLFPDDEPGLWMGLAFIVVFAAVTFIVSALSYNLFERRILAYKRFFEPRIAPPALELMPVDSLTESAESVLS